MVPSQRSLSSMQTLVQLLKLSWEQFRTQNRLDVPFSAVLLITNILMLQWYKEIWKCTFIVGNFSNCVIVVLVECMDGWQYPWLLEHIFGQIDGRYVKLKQKRKYTLPSSNAILSTNTALTFLMTIMWATLMIIAPIPTRKTFSCATSVGSSANETCGFNNFRQQPSSILRDEWKLVKRFLNEFNTNRSAVIADMIGKAMRPATAKDGSLASATEMEIANPTDMMPVGTNSMCKFLSNSIYNSDLSCQGDGGKRDGNRINHST